MIEGFKYLNESSIVCIGDAVFRTVYKDIGKRYREVASNLPGGCANSYDSNDVFRFSRLFQPVMKITALASALFAESADYSDIYDDLDMICGFNLALNEASSASGRIRLNPEIFKNVRGAIEMDTTMLRSGFRQMHGRAIDLLDEIEREKDENSLPKLFGELEFVLQQVLNEREIHRIIELKGYLEQYGLYKLLDDGTKKVLDGVAVTKLKRGQGANQIRND